VQGGEGQLWFSIFIWLNDKKDVSEEKNYFNKFTNYNLLC